MITKYDTDDEVLVPVKIVSARKYNDEILYEVKNHYDENGKPLLLPEGLIEGKAQIGVEKYYKERWNKVKGTIDEIGR